MDALRYSAASVFVLNLLLAAVVAAVGVYAFQAAGAAGLAIVAVGGGILAVLAARLTTPPRSRSLRDAVKWLTIECRNEHGRDYESALRQLWNMLDLLARQGPADIRQFMRDFGGELADGAENSGQACIERLGEQLAVLQVNCDRSQRLEPAGEAQRLELERRVRELSTMALEYDQKSESDIVRHSAQMCLLTREVSFEALVVGTLPGQRRRLIRALSVVHGAMRRSDGNVEHVENTESVERRLRLWRDADTLGAEYAASEAVPA